MKNETKEKRAQELMMRIEIGQTIAGLADFHYSNQKHAIAFENKFEEYFEGFSNVWLWIRDAAIAFDNQLLKLLGEGPYVYYIENLGKYAELISLESMKMDSEAFCATDWDQWFDDKAKLAIRERRVEG